MTATKSDAQNTTPPESATITVLRVPLPMDSIKKMSNEERSIMFLIGYAENQISMMLKFILFLTNKEPSDPLEQQVRGAQTQMLLRIMIGIIFETWEGLIKVRLLPRVENGHIKIAINAKGRNAVSKLRKHFGKSSFLGKIRNSFAFHHPNDEYMNKAFKTASQDNDLKNDWNWYLANERTNTCYFASEMVLMHGIMSAAKKTSLDETQEMMMKEANKCMTY